MTFADEMKSAFARFEQWFGAAEIGGGDIVKTGQDLSKAFHQVKNISDFAQAIVVLGLFYAASLFLWNRYAVAGNVFDKLSYFVSFIFSTALAAYVFSKITVIIFNLALIYIPKNKSVWLRVIFFVASFFVLILLEQGVRSVAEALAAATALKI